MEKEQTRQGQERQGIQPILVFTLCCLSGMSILGVIKILEMTSQTMVTCHATAVTEEEAQEIADQVYPLVKKGKKQK